jgi:hypothetical protein
MQLFLQLAPFVLLTAGIAACGFIFVSLKSEIQALNQRLNQRLKQHQEQFEALQTNLTAEFADTKTRLRESEERAGVLVPPSPPRSGLNLSKRSQALRMSRIGEKPENIAAALSLPRREVELLLKVQKIILSSNDITF